MLTQHAVVPDGYGVSYEINDNSIRWAVTTKNNNAEAFGHALVKAAKDMKHVMERAKAGSVRAKL
jgi:carnitine O-acetyltransferase